MSRVLKGDSGELTRPERAGGRVVSGDVADAHEEARRIVEGAQAELARLRDQARQEGFAAGRQEGLASVTELLVRARAEVARKSDESEPGLRRLAVRIAEKVLGAELRQDPAAVVAVVRTALAAARGRRELVIRVHPDDVAAMTGARPRLAEALARHAELVVRGDTSIARGGCLIDSEVGTIDGRLDVQLAAIERALCEEA
jgi:flagellar biosynthesis/type III secretory pathway protein FliH